jgi:hypothetical protein
VKLYLKNELKVETAGGMPQLVEHLSNKCKSLNSNPRTAKRKKRKEKEVR